MYILQSSIVSFLWHCEAEVLTALIKGWGWGLGWGCYNKLLLDCLQWIFIQIAVGNFFKFVFYSAFT